uniref:Nicotinamide phosphoribosyltransferase n=1 Tax=Arcella intermedia TaxID=1963864 RepID=A0A6B2L2A5_9EUKA
MVAYGEFRAPYDNDKTDTRFVFYGIRYIIENYLSKPWTVQDVENAEKFYSTHGAGNTPYPYPRDLFLKFVKENNGWFPVKIQALPEGTVCNVRVPVYQITAKKEYAKLVTFLETVLTHLWYPSTVATLSRRTKDIITDGYTATVDEDMWWTLDGRLHDFGFRGCTSVEQSVIGGSAHLLNWAGSDTMSAAYYAQFYLNGGRPVCQSIPATEHSVMTAWETEAKAIKNMIQRFGGENKVFACVMDSYDYEKALNETLPIIYKETEGKWGLMVLRPDSGDPVESVLMALRAGEKVGGVAVNKKGFKVLKGFAVIQGDGINYTSLRRIVDAVVKEGYSLCSVAFGMGAGLLQKLNRDTMSFATKLSHIEYADGKKRDIMKMPKTDRTKISHPGILKVKKVNDVPTVFPSTEDDADPENLLRVVWDNGPVKDLKWDDFDTLKARVNKEWSLVPKLADPVSKELKDKIADWIKEFEIKFQVNK